MGRKLYVGNLPYETNEQDLQELFAQAGNVETVTVMRDRDTGRARGFAFVEMSSDDEAQNAITKLNDQQFGGRRLTVNEARPQVPRSGGGGGGGGTAIVVLHVAANLAGRPRSVDGPVRGTAAASITQTRMPGSEAIFGRLLLWCRCRRRTCEVMRLAIGSLNCNTAMARFGSSTNTTPSSTSMSMGFDVSRPR